MNIEDMDPAANRLVKDAREHLGSYMKHCQEQMGRHNMAAAFYQEEIAIVKNFLSGGLAEPAEETVSDEDVKMEMMQDRVRTASTRRTW
jgi:hypothetical protein